VVRVRLLASLQEAVGSKTVEVEAEDWREALRKLREAYKGLEEVLYEDGTPRPGYLVFVDGVDHRLYEGGKPREVVILPVNHGGAGDVEVEVVSWSVLEELLDKIAGMIIESGFRPDVIVGILRGGVIPARILGDRLGVPDMATMEIKLYKGVGLRGDRPYLRQPPMLDLSGKNVLVVDDISDTGLTLQLAVEVVNLYFPREVRTATVYIKPWTDFVPDYYGAKSRNWIVFPWEREEYRREVEEEDE